VISEPPSVIDGSNVNSNSVAPNILIAAAVGSEGAVTLVFDAAFVGLT
jgi:hypothetical protein